MKIDLIKPGLALLCVFFSVMWLHQCSKPEVDNSVEQENHALKSRVAELEAGKLRDSLSIDSARLERQKVTATANAEIAGLKKEKARLATSLAKARQDISLAIDTIPQVKRFTEVADSTIAVTDSLYRRSESARVAESKLFEFEMAKMADKYVKEVAISGEYKARVDELTNQNQRLTRRLERKRKFNGVLLGISGGLAAAIAVITLTN